MLQERNSSRTTLNGQTWTSNFFGHWRTIRKHRKWVRRYCWNLGLYWQGLVHDISKYNPVEFWRGVKYYQGGTSSPINAEKSVNHGFSAAWMHHKSHNKHHYEYWVDHLDDSFTYGMVPMVHPMPYKYFAEMLCDYLGAARAYLGDKFTYKAELEWWMKKRNQCAMHDCNKRMLDIIFSDLAVAAREEVARPGTWATPKELLYHGTFDHIGYVENVYNANTPEYLRTRNYKEPTYVDYGG